MQTIKVLHTVRNVSHYAGGVTIAILKLLDELAKEIPNQQLCLTAHEDEACLIDHQIHSNLEYNWQPLTAPTFWGLHWQFKKVIEEQLKSIDNGLIHDNGIWLPNNYSVARIAKTFNIPRVVSVHGMLEPWALGFNSWKKKIAWNLFQEKALQSAYAIHATSIQEAENIRKAGINVPIAVIPLGVDIPDSELRPNENDKKTILFLSRIQQKKGLLNLVKAWNEIQDENWQIIIAGPDEGGHKQEVESLINSLGLRRFFSFPGNIPQDEKWAYYEAADLFVLPSFSENFGIVIVEALGKGVPVITTKATPWEDIETNNCGWWIDVGVEPLINALKIAIHTEEDQLVKMGSRGIELVQEKYTWHKTAKNMLTLYNWVIHKTEKPDFIVN